MRRIMQLVDTRADEYAKAPLFALMRDTSVDPRQRLAFVPALSHFVMTFADIYALVLREEPTSDELQQLVNVHTREDGGHWRWFLADLDKLGHDPRSPRRQMW